MSENKITEVKCERCNRLVEELVPVGFNWICKDCFIKDPKPWWAVSDVVKPFGYTIVDTYGTV